MISQRKGPSDIELNSNFDSLLRQFHGLWDKFPKEFKKFEALKEKAKTTSLTGRQLEAIIDRCNNVINGTYGDTKKGITFKAS